MFLMEHFMTYIDNIHFMTYIDTGVIARIIKAHCYDSVRIWTKKTLSTYNNDVSESIY